MEPQCLDCAELCDLSCVHECHDISQPAFENDDLSDLDAEAEL